MKISFMLKASDGVYDCIERAAAKTRPEGLTDEEWGYVVDSRRAGINQKVSKWIGEYVQIEIDTDAGTATVKDRW